MPQNSSKKIRVRSQTKNVRSFPAKAPPLSSNRAKTERRAAPKKIIFVSAAIVLLLLGGAWWFLGGGSTLGVRMALESYLEDKYDKDFIVGPPHLQGAGLGITGSYRAVAHPKDDESLVFEVGKVQEKEQFFDRYTNVVWEHEERMRIETFLEGLYQMGQAPEFDLSTGIPSAQEPNPISGHVPGIDQAIQQYKDTLYYYLSVRFSVQTLDAQARDDLRTKFIKLSDYIEGRGVRESRLSFIISVIDENAGYQCSTSDISPQDSPDAVLNYCLNVQSKRGVY